MKKLFPIFAFVCVATRLWAIVGDWKVYPSVDCYWRIVQMADRYYLLNGHTLVTAEVAHLDDPDGMRTLSRLDGLNGAEIQDIAVQPALEKLAIVYTDGNIDIMDRTGQVRNLPDYANHSITGDRSIRGIGIEDQKLYVGTGFGGFEVDMKEEVILSTWYDTNPKDNLPLAHCREVVANHTNDSLLLPILEQLQPVNGAMVQQAAQMSFRNGHLYAAQSTYNDYINYQWGTPVISILDAGSDVWHNITASRIDPMLKKLDKYAKFQKITGIAPDYSDPERFTACSLEGGIYQFDGDSLVGYYNALLNPEGMTSVLKTNEQQKSVYTRVGAVQMDESGYLWFTNGDKESEYTLRCITPEGEFLKYHTPGFSGYCNNQFGIIGRMTFSQHDSYHFKWLTRTFHINSAAVCIYYDGDDPEAMSNDTCTMFSTLVDQDGNKYNLDYFHDLAEDKEGAIWLLTSIGPFVIDDQYMAFFNPGSVRRIKIPRNDGTNLADYLLSEISCRCIYVDPANRKWIGTDNSGLYLLSPDGMTQLEHFTTDNSPLFCNRISGLTMDEETGTLYIGTDGGICAYETDVLKDVPDNSGLYCYPNPVRPEYAGPLNILGFRNGSTISITDVNHHVVFKEKSDGSIIHWNLEGNDGKRVKPGIYYIDAIEENGKKGASFKFLVI